MTDKQIISLFRKHGPTRLKHIKKLGLTPVKIGEGISRKVYLLNDNLVVKFTFSGKANYQSKNEINSIKKVYCNPKLKKFRRHVPPLLYFDYQGGVIITKYYPKDGPWEGSKKFQTFAKKLYKIGLGDDIHMGNVRRDKNGVLVIVDCGGLEESC